MLLRCVSIALVVLAALAAADPAPVPHPQTHCGAQLNVGFRIHTFSGGLRAAIWYPTTAAESAFEYANELATTIAKDAPVAACESYPLVVFSHGYGGCGTQSVFFTEELARRGYIVVGPDHQDAACKVDQPRRRSWPKAPEEPFRQPEKWSDANYANRRDDVRLVLDQMLADPEFGRQIDPNRIGVCGHSLGGYTALGVSGAWSSWEDRRIRAALLFSPYVTPFLSQHTLKQVDIPVMYQGGTLDFGVTPFLRREGGAYDSSSPPKFYVELAATGHLDWSVKVCDGQDSVEQCATSVRKARLINQYGIGFFDHFLKQVPELGFPARTVPGVVDYRQAR